MTEYIKIVFVGDEGIGKTALLMSFVTREFPREYIPNIFDNVNCKIDFERRIVDISIWDTVADEDYDRLRPLSYPETNVFVIAFSLDDRTSFENVKTKWYPEIQEHAPGVPIMLLGTKLDLRKDEDEECDEPKIITHDEGEQLEKDLKLQRYRECSAKSREGLNEIFHYSIGFVIGHDGGIEHGPFAPKTERMKREVNEICCKCEYEAEGRCCGIEGSLGKALGWINWPCCSCMDLIFGLFDICLNAKGAWFERKQYVRRKGFTPHKMSELYSVEGLDNSTENV